MDKILINPNVLNLKESSTLAINQKAKDLKAQGKEVYHFGFGQSPFPVPQIIVDELKKYATCKDYLPTKGLFELRREISHYLEREFNEKFHHENILIGPGSKELIFQTLFVLEGPVILLSPSWVSYKPQVDLKRSNTKILATKKENNYCVTAEELDSFCANLSSEQKILIINNPNNPTGHFYEEDQIKDIAEVCKKHNIILISDEIYSQINFTDKPFVSFAKYLPDRTIITGGLSKIFSAGGYRLGFMAIPNSMKDIIKPVVAMFSETFSSVCAPVQYAAVKAYSHSDQITDYIASCRKIHKELSSYIYHRLIKMDIDCSRPQGAFYLFLDFEKHRDKLNKKNIHTAKELCDYLLDQFGVALLPGEDFYMEEKSLTCRLATVDYDGSQVLATYQSDNNINEDFVIRNCPSLYKGCNQIQSFIESL